VFDLTTVGLAGGDGWLCDFVWLGTGTSGSLAVGLDSVAGFSLAVEAFDFPNA
jgi:hypothetical protein